MDNQDYATDYRNDAGRKIRSRSSRNSRSTPYKRTITRDRNQNLDASSSHEQSLIGRVTSYIVPSWISGWMTQSKTNAIEQSDSDDSEADDDVIGNKPLQETSQVMRQSVPNRQTTSVESNINEKFSMQTGFYERYRSVENSKELIRPSFINDTKDERTEEDSPDVGLSSIGESKHVDTPPMTETLTSHSVPTAILTASFHRTNRKRASVSKPAFRVSAFVPPNQHSSTSFNTSLNSSSFDFTSSSRSTFYSGRTMFGGSSTVRENATKRLKMMPVSTTVQTIRTQIRAKPLRRATKRSAITSETAKKILSTLDKMSSPLKDSRKLPPHLKNLSTTSEKLRESGRTRQISPCAPPVQNLITPEVLKSSTAKNAKSMIIGASQEIEQNVPSLSFTPQSLPALFSSNSKSSIFSNVSKTRSENADPFKSSMKMRRERNVHYSSGQKDEETVNTMPEVSVAVPLVVNSLPNFKFSVAPSKALPTFTPIPKTTDTRKTMDDSPIGYNFASPGIIGNKALLTTPNKYYTFSSPTEVIDDNKDITKSVESKNNFSGHDFQSISEAKVETHKETVVKQSSYKNVEPTNRIGFKSFASKFSKPSGSWRCSNCFVQNESSSDACVACTEKKPATEQPIKTTSKSTETETKTLNPLKFAQAEAGSWKCPSCMIQNKKDVLKCVACSAAKPENSITKTLKLSKPPKGSWKCPQCMIINKETDSKCVACTETKPESIAPAASKPKNIIPMRQLKLKPPDIGSWACPTCMIRNKKESLKCNACEEAKPGSDKPSLNNDGDKPVLAFQQVIDSSTEISNFKFGQAGDTATGLSNFKFGQNNDSSTGNSNFKFGQVSDSATGKSDFKFGQVSDSATGKSDFKFGQVSDSATRKSDFKFGQVGDSATGKSDFKFGLPNDATGSTSNIKFGQVSDTATNKPTFVFGQPSEATASKPTFAFGQPSDAVTSKPLFMFGQSSDATTSKPTDIVPTNSTSLSEQDNAVKNSFLFGQSSAPTSGLFGDINTSSFVTKQAEEVGPSSLVTKAVPENKSQLQSIADAARGGLLDIPSVGNSKTAQVQMNSLFTSKQFGSNELPGATQTSTLFATTTSHNPIASGDFKSNVLTSESQATFTFGVKPEKDSNFSTKSTNLFGLKSSDMSSMPGFTFGANKAESDNPSSFFCTNSSVTSTGFDATTLPLNHIDNALVNPMPTLSTKSSISTGGFNFGSTTMAGNAFGSFTPSVNFGTKNNASFNQNPIETTSSSFHFGNKTTSVAPALNFGGNKETSDISTGFNFGAKDAAPSTATTGFKFGASDSIFQQTAQKNTTPQSGFDFSSSTKGATFNFNNGVVPTFESGLKRNTFASNSANSGNLFNMGASSTQSNNVGGRRIRRAIRRGKKP